MILRLSLFAALAAAALALGCACSQQAASVVYPASDLQPPGLLEAGPRDARSLVLRFDEAVRPVEGSYALEPKADISCRAVEGELELSLGSDQRPGLDYVLGGEVDDLRGNRTRFLLRFVGWNGRPPSLRLSEIQTGKNASKTRRHRDFVELELLSDGNLGGVELSWTSSVKSASYRFPGIEARRGDFIVLHLAPEGIADEKDELGEDLGASGGVDASPGGRDLWSSVSPLPDESGALSLALRPGEAPVDGFFYAAEGRSGPVGDDRLGAMLAALCAAGRWPMEGAKPAWEDAFRWKSSTARSLCRREGGGGAQGWYASAAGAQSPGAANADPSSQASGEERKAVKKKTRKAGPKSAKP